ncbi:ASCH domain-containing protein [Microbacterium sp. QXD-8]|uniref:ASCH domain-containing protein n=1 Tax=Microbacterium psychrotolerans TaxID=3068321 RepID=A0ABU0YW68_9MICO|nr:ASCH domain-containing protein [Microbacterium sp. QXD-8]MDQ7876576.1 ASCH domain-containing protein [Microbacterium sp. QXD-8]
MTAVLLSVRPRYAHALLAGTKTAEVRRRFPHQPRGTILYLYSSSPERAILGTVRLHAIDRPSADRVWHLYRDQIEIEEAALDDYLSDLDSAAILRVNDSRRWRHPVPLRDVRARLGIEPPQSFRYLTDEHVKTLGALRSHQAQVSLYSVVGA